MFLCLMTILENFPQIYYYEVLNLRKESYMVQHPNPLSASEKEFPEACAGISSCP